MHSSLRSESKIFSLLNFVLINILDTNILIISARIDKVYVFFRKNFIQSYNFTYNRKQYNIN